MRHIPIGTCVPGTVFDQWAPKLRSIGFESFAINFHMRITEEIIASLPDTAKKAREEIGAPISILGYYCNSLQYEEHKALLEKCIDIAPRRTGASSSASRTAPWTAPGKRPPATSASTSAPGR